jgi:hypothetical protein
VKESDEKITLKQIESTKNALILSGTGDHGCPQSMFAISKTNIKAREAAGFCEGLNQTQRKTGQTWELADANTGSQLRDQCNFEDFVQSSAELQNIFPETARSRLSVWYKYPPAVLGSGFPILDYPLRKVPGSPEMVNGKPMQPVNLPVLCYARPTR